MRKTTTIAAIATAMSPGGISIIRISGPEAFAIIDRIYTASRNRLPGDSVRKLSQAASHTIHYGYIYNQEEMLDEVMVSVMRGPRSFTAEDTVEINCHGGILVTRRVLECVFSHGAVPAEPGEFTKRAFLNGRIDLSQAEAVMDLISAKSEYAAKASLEQLKGSLKNCISELRSGILDEIAFIEAALDDPEHISLDGYQETLHRRMESFLGKINDMIVSFENGRVLSEGIRTVIIGKPNAGKSSLLNVMAGRQKAIVTEIAGTTRDILEESVVLDGIPLLLIDTAGIRETDDVVEKIGVKRAQEAIYQADLLLYVADSSRELDQDDFSIMELLKGRKSIILLNKSDLPAVTTVEDIRAHLDAEYVLSVSVETQAGMEVFTEALKKMFFQGELEHNDQVMITNIRQKVCLSDAKESLALVLQNLGDMPEDMLTIDMMNAYTSLGYVIGEEVEEDLVNRIFQKFCMGK